MDKLNTPFIKILLTIGIPLIIIAGLHDLKVF